MTCIGNDVGFRDGCGMFGQCEDILCTCEPGWSQSTEFCFFLEDISSSKNFSLIETLPCDTHFGILSFLYWVLAISLFLNIVIQLAFIRRFRQLKRILPWILSMAFNLIAAGIKLQNIRSVNFGEDLMVTVFFSLGYFFGNLGSSVFLYKFIFYQKRMISFSNRTQFILSNLTVAEYIGTMNDFIGALAQCALAFYNSEETRALYLMIGCYILVELMLNDSKVLAIPSTLNKRLKKHFETLRRVRVAVVLFGVQTIFCCLSSLLSFVFLNMWKYFLPSNTALAGITGIIVVFRYQQGRGGKTRETTIQVKKDKDPSFQNFLSTPQLNQYESELVYAENPSL
eukprot:snap_masked-scaffold_7-processed-gene-2.54-mRNA-1 protein AED:1.00 eAED:1.00 QI:0/0/0/0/1/1/2/0/340